MFAFYSVYNSTTQVERIEDIKLTAESTPTLSAELVLPEPEPELPPPEPLDEAEFVGDAPDEAELPAVVSGALTDTEPLFPMLMVTELSGAEAEGAGPSTPFSASAFADSWAKPTEGGVARYTEYTFF